MLKVNWDKGKCRGLAPEAAEAELPILQLRCHHTGLLSSNTVHKSEPSIVGQGVQAAGDGVN